VAARAIVGVQTEHIIHRDVQLVMCGEFVDGLIATDRDMHRDIHPVESNIFDVVGSSRSYNTAKKTFKSKDRHNSLKLLVTGSHTGKSKA